MTQEELARRFGLSAQTVLDYEQAGLLHPARQPPQYPENEIGRLGLIDTLVKVGFNLQAIRQYVDLSTPEQLRTLRTQRSKLLGELHGKQQTLDNIDYMIWEKANKQ